MKPLPGPQRLSLDGEEQPGRRPWHWSLIGVVAIFAVWLPLAAVAGWWTRRLVAAESATLGGSLRNLHFGERADLALRALGPGALAFAVACVVGGGLVGYFAKPSGLDQATVAGVLAAISAGAIAMSSGLRPSLMSWIVLALAAALGAAMACFGGWIGRALSKRVSARRKSS